MHFFKTCIKFSRNRNFTPFVIFRIANDDFELFLFRVSTFIKTRNLKPENEEARLCKTRPAFFGLYPGEPYIYSDSEHPNELYLKVKIDHCILIEKSFQSISRIKLPNSFQIGLGRAFSMHRDY